jgi:hypothetical protein
VGPGPDETSAAIHHKVAGRPDGGRADIGREDGIVRSRLAEHTREVLRMNGLVSRRAAGEFIEPRTGPSIMGQAVVEVHPVDLHGQFRQQRVYGGTNVTHDAEVEPAATTQILRPDVDLSDLGLGRKNCL